MDILSVLQTTLLVAMVIIYYRQRGLVKRLYNIGQQQDKVLHDLLKTLSADQERLGYLEVTSLQTINTVNNLLDRSVQLGIILNEHSDTMETINKEILCQYGKVDQTDLN